MTNKVAISGVTTGSLALTIIIWLASSGILEKRNLGDEERTTMQIEYNLYLDHVSCHPVPPEIREAVASRAVDDFQANNKWFVWGWQDSCITALGTWFPDSTLEVTMLP